MYDLIDRVWNDSAVPSLEEYVRIPNQSPGFDTDWESNGLLTRAAEHVAEWCRANGPDALQIELFHSEGRTPLIFMELDGDGEGTVLLYGHVDKQPPMLPWDEGLDPYDPVIRDGRLFGRGAADDGYAAYASVLALRALAGSGAEFGRCVIVVEACEESGSHDLPAWLDELRPRIGDPDLVVCLDSGCGNFDQLWVTTSLRGAVIGHLSVDVLTEGVHSGDAGGVVPDSFRIVRSLLDRVEDARTGEILLESCRSEIPEERSEQAVDAAAAIGLRLTGRFPWAGDTASSATGADAVLNRTWRPSLAVLGADGLPTADRAGGVLRPATRLVVSVRTPPTADADAVAAELHETLTTDPPYGATVTFERGFCASGWSAPATQPWLTDALEAASRRHFGAPLLSMGEGGTIPFMSMLADEFPEAQFLITGVLGPNSNAHGPNEFLDLDYARRLTCCVTDVIAAHATR